MINETFGLEQVAEQLGGLTKDQLRHRRRKLSNFLESHELHGERNRVYIDQVGLKILEEAEEIYQEDQAPYTNISDLEEFQSTVEKIEEEHGAEVTVEKGVEKKDQQLEQRLESAKYELEALQRQKQTMDKVRESIIERLTVTDSVGKEGLNAITTALDVLQQARIPLEKSTDLTPK